jgi:hypothetical protein
MVDKGIEAAAAKKVRAAYPTWLSRLLELTGLFMNEYNFEVSFRITHPSMSPDTICGLLSMETDVKRKVGEARYNPKGKPLPGVWKETYCGFDVPRKEGDSIPECLVVRQFCFDDQLM